ncbi:hypothetical protein BUE93_20355 [Chromobacterium amazonense]|uniref:Toxin co-regulated pilus biosynthesis protein Q C-terminal domain-containing protein n=1 Tax=Chromobacterium amazonense TaxID=1382803 RepID=A0A2S9WZA9_9NEIS|nr:hypothetical protein [Chromobacterium amazonense]PRP68801.1 hypothetical protein BUE93_20355 [Chromobacterium amazonense]
MSRFPSVLNPAPLALAASLAALASGCAGLPRSAFTPVNSAAAQYELQPATPRVRGVNLSQVDAVLDRPVSLAAPISPPASPPLAKVAEAAPLRSDAPLPSLASAPAAGQATPDADADRLAQEAAAQAQVQADQAQAADARRRAMLTLRVAGGQWLPEAIQNYLDQQVAPMDLEWNVPSQYRIERGLAEYGETPQQAVFSVVRHYGLSVCVWKGNVKPVLEVYQAGVDEEKCRDQ